MSYLKTYCLPFFILILMISLNIGKFNIEVYADEKMQNNEKSKTYNVEVIGTNSALVLGEDEKTEDGKTDNDNPNNPKPPLDIEDSENPKTGDDGILRWITISIYSVIALVLYNLGRRMKKINKPN